MELDEKHRLFAPLKSGTLIEFGISPGSWIQYYQEKIGSSVTIIGIDQKPFKAEMRNGVVLTEDILELTAKGLRQHTRGDIVAVISDALPNLTGNRIRDQVNIANLRNAITELTLELLKEGGLFVMKTFYEPELDGWFKRMRKVFEKFYIEKPKASRKESPEVYIVGLGFKGNG